MKRRSDSYFGLHFDFHAAPSTCPDPVGATLSENEIREICRLLKPDFLQIDCKGHPGWASYPTACGNAMPAFRGDPLEVWRRVTKEEGVALYMHYSGVIDIEYCQRNPDESVLLADGRRSAENGADMAGGVTRTNGRYADALLIPQLKELAGRYGVDGVWIDGDCWGSQTDFDPETIRAFEQETGIDLGGKLPAERGAPYYEEYREYCRELFRRYVRHYVDSVHAEYPDFQIASNWAYTDHMPEKVSSNADFISGDLNPWNGFNSARYAGRAIAQQNHTWDLMSWNFRGMSSHIPTYIVKTPLQIMQEAAAVISLGGGFQNYITQFRDGSPRMDQIRKMKPVEEFMRAREPFCFRGKAVHQAAVLLSTYDRHRESASLFSRNGCEKILGLTALVCDAGHSAEIVSEHTIAGRCADYPVIIVPELYAGLAPETINELLDYAKNGGSLVLVGENTCRLFAEAGAPFAAGEKTEGGWLFTMNGEEFGTAEGIRAVCAENAEVCARYCMDSRSEQKPMASVAPFGSGRIAAIGCDIGLAYNNYGQYLHVDLIKLVLSKLYSPIVRVEGCKGVIEVTVLAKDGKTLIQLVNANGQHRSMNYVTEDYIPECRRVQLSIALAEKPAALVLQPEGRTLDFTYENGRACVTVDEVAVHEIIEVVK